VDIKNEKRKRADKNDNKLAISGSIEDVIRLSTTPYTPKPKKVD
jgi:hypothetical protein